MRYGIFSDVHSNLEALTAVLTALAGDSVDRVLCGGDLVGYAAEPEACVAAVRQAAHGVVAGNHDWAVAGRFPFEWFQETARVALQWTTGQISPATAQYLAALPLTWRDEQVTVAHGTLHEPEAFHYLLDTRQAEASFKVQRTPVAFVGHTHVPVVFRREADGTVRVQRDPVVPLHPGLRYLVNVGSVGQPRDHHPEATYCLYDTAAARVEFKRVPYPVGITQGKIRAAGLPVRFADRLGHGI